MRESRSRRGLALAAAGALCLAGALALLALTQPAGVVRESVEIAGPGGRPCGGALWLPREPAAVVILGHGVTENRGCMAALAKIFAANGYAVVAVDFWGHGRSRVPFDWGGNPAQIHVWCAWARERFPGLPLGYLGHSMGGFAGTEAFAGDAHGVDAFVALGALPGRIPKPQTLIAAGRFEELFSPEEARQTAGTQADVLISPRSNHALEPWDFTLARGIVEWMTAALAVDRVLSFSAARHFAALLAAPLGVLAAFLLAAAAVGGMSWTEATETRPPFNLAARLSPYGLAARLFGCGNPSGLVRVSPPLTALLQAAAFCAVFVLALSLVFDRHFFTSLPFHPGRTVKWLGLGGVFSGLALLDLWLLNRATPNRGVRLFLVAALTRMFPWVLGGLVLYLLVPGAAFGGMMLFILAFILGMVSLAQAAVVRVTGNPRAGALTAGMLAAYVFAYWFPVT